MAAALAESCPTVMWESGVIESSKCARCVGFHDVCTLSFVALAVGLYTSGAPLRVVGQARGRLDAVGLPPGPWELQGSDAVGRVSICVGACLDHHKDSWSVLKALLLVDR